MRTICLVSCVGKKLDKRARAELLYRSQWFRLAAVYARTNSDEWRILSAKHGLVKPSEWIEPYDKTLNTMPIQERKAWSKEVIKSLSELSADKFIILAGSKYREFIEPWFISNNVDYDVPMRGLGIGKQLKFLKEHT